MKKNLNHLKYLVLTGLLFALPVGESMAQYNVIDTISKPVVLYSAPKKYEIAGITVSGIDNYEDHVLIGISGLSVGQVITVPGEEITAAVKRYWKHGLFSNVSISVEKIIGDQAYLNIALTQRPRLSKLNFYGVKKTEQDDLEAKLSFRQGNQITPNMIDRAKIVIKRYFDEKGFKNADISIVARTITIPGKPAIYFMVNAPPRAPMTMIPSRPKLITPERSEKQPPNATSINTEA